MCSTFPTSSPLTCCLVMFQPSPYTGLLLTVLNWTPLLNDPKMTAAYQNFLITIEMFFASILLFFAFPYKLYMDLRKDGQGRGVPVKHITSHFKDTINPHDVVDDAIHNFSRVYQKYAQQGDLSEDELDHRAGGVVASSDEDSVKRRTPTKKVKSKEFERVTLLVESDEDEIL